MVNERTAHCTQEQESKQARKVSAKNSAPRCSGADRKMILQMLIRSGNLFLFSTPGWIINTEDWITTDVLTAHGCFGSYVKHFGNDTTDVCKEMGIHFTFSQLGRRLNFLIRESQRTMD